MGPSRRALLASIGTVGLAGCLGLGDESTAESTPATTPSPSPDESTPAGTATTGRDSTPESGQERPSYADGEPSTPDSIDSDWTHPGADPGRSNYAAGVTGPTEAVAPLWSTSTNADLTAPVLADETVFVGAHDGVVRALDARTGDERWQKSVGERAGRPQVVDDRVVVPTDAGLRALAVSDGSEQWEASIVPADLLATADGVYVVGSDETDEQTLSVVRLRTDDGTEQWRNHLSDPWQPPLIAGGDRLYVSTDHRSPDPWTFDRASGEFLLDHRPGTTGADFVLAQCYVDGSLFLMQPMFPRVEARAVTTDGVDWKAGLGYRTYLFGLTGGRNNAYVTKQAEGGDALRVSALALADGTSQWDVEVRSEPDSLETGRERRAVVADETVLVRTSDALRCYDSASGDELWAVPGDDVGSSPVVADDLVFTTAGDTVLALRPP